MIRRCRVTYRILQHFLRVPLQVKLLLIKASLLLIFLRILLKVSSVNKIYPLINFFLKKPSCSYKDHLAYTARVVWAIEKSGKYLLRTRCLAEAIAVQILLNKRRIATKLRIGFIKDKDRFSAHAWVTADNKILIGNTQAIPYYFKIAL
jgi:hypothetical protein